MKPERILRKHRLGANVSDRRIARAAYDDAVAMRAGKAPSEVAWGPVAKAMCISALLHPKPSALVGCADASVQGLKYTEDALTRVELENVLERVRMRLTSALVLDEIARELTPQQRAAAETDRDCISDYLEHRGIPVRRCGPVAVLLLTGKGGRSYD